MNIIRSLYRWGTLYILVGVFMGALFWEENLNTKPGDHTLLAFGIVFGFGFLLNRWITHHEANFLVSQFYQSRVDQEKSERRLENNIHSEKKQ
ncbi:MAG: hypothetical protein LLG42_13970 [Chloroflexi bacterium]|jgi:hypothetical protein|nr:hypothetical protein [Chloroflexota bacterium]